MAPFHHHHRLTFVKVAFTHHHHHSHHNWLAWFFRIKGDSMFTPGPVTLVVGGTTTATVLGFDQNGNLMALPPGTTVTFSIDNTAVATSTPNADNLTDAIVAVGGGVANLSATVVAPNGTFSDSETVTVTDVVPVLSSVKVAFGS
jgi:hypothetical protein